VTINTRLVDNPEPARVSTGSVGLDDILGGGLDANRVYLYEGRPGTGKTTFAMQFLMEGARRGERTLYVSLSESRRELALVARRHGWSLDGIDIFDPAHAAKALSKTIPDELSNSGNSASSHHPQRDGFARLPRAS
jgi:KaiC/GvpD/RAD55 family RecA-like ATPase